MNISPGGPTAPPHQTYTSIFLRFLRFGLLAWGGPVAQIAMIRQELVDEERWVSSERFNRVLAVYQALPGPEAHELCVYFGTVARGRLGGLLAGLGFMLPGLLLMLVLSWAYGTFGIGSPIVASIFYGCQPAVAALIVRAVHRIGGHVLHSRLLWAIAIGAALAQVAGLHFLLILLASGLISAILRRQLPNGVAGFLAIPVIAAQTAQAVPSLLALFGYGLRSGLLTFGGAYTVIPFLQRDAVINGGWMTNQQFLDGMALANIIPAPLVIISTFVGYLANGVPGALAITAGVFVPAFAFTLIGHQYVERLIENQAAHAILDGITAGVIGLIAVTAINLTLVAVTDLPTAAIFVIALYVLFRWKSKAASAVVVLCSALAGITTTLLMP